MTIRLVRSGATFVTGGTWADAYTSLAAALTASAANDIILVSDAHVFAPVAAITYTQPAGNITIICVTPTGLGAGVASYSAWSTGASESVGNFAGQFTITGVNASTMYMRGMTLNAGSANNASCDLQVQTSSDIAQRLHFDTCILAINAPNTSAQFAWGSATTGGNSGSYMLCTNCTIKSTGSRAGTMISLGSIDLTMLQCTIDVGAGTKPVVMFGPTSGSRSGSLTVADCDLNGFSATSNALVDVAGLGPKPVLFKNCKINTQSSFETGSWLASSSGSITVRNCNSGAVFNAFQYRDARGVLQQTTGIVASSGASFQSTAIAWDVLTRAACNENNVFTTPLLRVENASTSAQTASVEFITDDSAPQNDRQIWMNFAYPNSASFPSFAWANDRGPTPIDTSASATAGAAQATGAATWSGATYNAMTNNTGQGKGKCSVGFTAARASDQLEATVSLSPAGVKQFYIDPVLRVA